MSTFQAAGEQALAPHCTGTPPASIVEAVDDPRMFGPFTVRETFDASARPLVVEGLNLQTTKTTAEVTMVQEGGAWKVDKESWKTTSK